MSSAPHIYRSGSFAPASADDLRLYYDGAWHNPCAGPKTLWWRKNGVWERFPCIVADKFFLYSPDPNGTYSDYGIHGVDFLVTRPTLTLNGARDFSTFMGWNRDYSALLAAQFFNWDGPPGSNDESFLVSGGYGIPQGITIEFDPTLPAGSASFSFQIGKETGFNSWDNSLTNSPTLPFVGPYLPFIYCEYDDGTVDHLAAAVGSTRFVKFGPLNETNAPPYLLGIQMGIEWSGTFDSSQWFNIYWKPPELDNVSQTGSYGISSYDNTTGRTHNYRNIDYLTGTPGARIKKLKIGWFTADPQNGLWIQSIRCQVGSDQVFHWNPAYDGFPIQTQFPSTQDPGYDDYLDNSPKPFTVTVQPDGDSVFLDDPNPSGSFDGPIADYVESAHLSHSHAFALWAWNPDTDIDGINDKTRSDSLGWPGGLIAYQRSDWDKDSNPNVTITDHLPPGFPGTYSYGSIDVAFTVPSTTVTSPATPTDLYRVCVQEIGDVLLKEVSDYATQADGRVVGWGNPKFSTDGSKIAFMKRYVVSSVEHYKPCVINRDGSGYEELVYGIYEPFILDHAWSPSSNDFYFYESLHSSSYYIVQAWTDGTTSPDVLLAGIYQFGILRVDPSGTVLGGLKYHPGDTNAFFNLISFSNTPGTPPSYGTGYPIPMNPGAVGLSEWAWSPDGSKVMIITDVDEMSILDLSSATIDVTTFADTYHAFKPTWFHGW